MKKTNRSKVEEFIRVDHAGERGAIKIYEGQLLALNTFVKNDELKKTIEEMKEHEREHCNYFENEIKKRNIKPTKLLPLWDILGVGLGFGSTILGEKATMLCTASVEEVIDKHYANQIDQLENDENIIEITAVNTGTSPPNTSRIELVDSKTKYPIITQLEIGKSAIIKIVK